MDTVGNRIANSVAYKSFKTQRFGEHTALGVRDGQRMLSGASNFEVTSPPLVVRERGSNPSKGVMLVL